MTVVRAIESFICPDGSVGAGDLLDSSDPLVKGREHLFEDIKPKQADVLLTAVEAPPEETDSDESIEAAETGEAEADNAPVAGGLKTTDVPARGRRSRK